MRGLCVECGSILFYQRCSECGFLPVTEVERAKAYILSTEYFVHAENRSKPEQELFAMANTVLAFDQQEVEEVIAYQRFLVAQERRWTPRVRDQPLSAESARREALWWLSKKRLFDCTPSSSATLAANLPGSAKELFGMYPNIRCHGDAEPWRLSQALVRESTFLPGLIRIGLADGSQEIVVDRVSGACCEVARYVTRRDVQRDSSASVYHYIVENCRFSYPHWLHAFDPPADPAE